MHDGLRGTLDALVGAFDQLLTALREHLDRHVVGDQVLGDDLADEVEVGLAGGREADLDLLEAHPHDLFEHAHLAGRIHRVDERLVAVAQVDRAPQRRVVDDDVRPRAIVEDDRHRSPVLVERHRAWCHVGGWHVGAPGDSIRKSRTPRPVRRGVRATQICEARPRREGGGAAASHHRQPTARRSPTAIDLTRALSGKPAHRRELPDILGRS